MARQGIRLRGRRLIAAGAPVGRRKERLWPARGRHIELNRLRFSAAGSRLNSNSVQTLGPLLPLRELSQFGPNQGAIALDEYWRFGQYSRRIHRGRFLNPIEVLPSPHACRDPQGPRVRRR
ncbi:hypothetical protein MPLA_1220031 [Mesorhizobium sp. ORS 3359]|nr:hypothetical protein MPLA_1220031 [Mesorhizobium sp. ORS 3359]